MKPLRCLLVLLVGLLVGLFVGGDLLAKPPASRYRRKKPAATGRLPRFDKVVATVEKQLAENRNYRPGDLLTRGQVDPLFRKLERMNWDVDDRAEILKLILPDGDWLARQFSTADGREFMRQIANLPDGYDRVDRYRRMPYGEQQLADLIRGPGGYKLIEYMTSTQGGRNLGDMLSQGVNGRDFNRPTGRIYTQIDFIKRLKKSYDAEAERRLALEPSQPAGGAANSSKQSDRENGRSGETAKPDTPSSESESDDPFEKLPASKSSRGN